MFPDRLILLVGFVILGFLVSCVAHRGKNSPNASFEEVATISNQAAPPEKPPKLDENVHWHYELWRSHKDLDPAEIQRWIDRGVRGTSPTNEEFQHITAARLVVEPKLSVSVDLPTHADAATLEAAGFKLWKPQGEPDRVHTERGLVARVYIEVELPRLLELANIGTVIHINWAPVDSMRAYQGPEPDVST